MRRVKHLALGIVTLLVVLALGETAVRNFPQLQSEQLQVRYQAIASNAIFVPDRELGFLPPPRTRQRVETPDFNFFRETDSRGFPNRGVWPARVGLLVLGDSLVLGEGVGLDRSFVSLVSRALPDTPVLNLGVAGAGPDRQYRIYKRYAAPLEPRVVLVFLYVAADLTNSIHFTSWLKEAHDRNYNKYRLNYSKQRDNRGYLNPARILDKSRLIALVRAEIAKLRGGDAASGVVRTRDRRKVILALPTLEFLENTEPSGAAFDQMVRHLFDLDLEVRAHGGRCVVVLIPSKEEVFRAHMSPRVLALAQAVKRQLAREQITCLDLQPVLTAASRDRSPYFERDIHLNEYGNEVVARQLISWMEQEAIPRTAVPETVAARLEGSGQ